MMVRPMSEAALAIPACRCFRIDLHWNEGKDRVMPKKCSANSSDVCRNPLPVVSRRRLRFGVWLLVSAICWLAISSSGAAQDAGVAHPLDPLSKEEIAAAAQTLKTSGKVTEA